MQPKHELQRELVDEKSTGTLSGATILIVDDEPAEQRIVAAKLQATDATRKLISVSSEPEALAVLGSTPVDCVLLDYQLSGKKSEGLIEHIRSNFSFLPVISMSGAGSEDKAVSVLRMGAADYLPKGKASRRALDRAVTNAIAKFQLARELDQEKQQLIAANEVLMRQQREIQSFYHTVSHELKTPITAIREFNALLLDGILGEINEEQRDAVETSIGCCDRLNRLVNDLFDTARLETGKLQLHKKAVCLNSIIKQEMLIMRPLAEHKSISLEVTEWPADTSLKLDAARIGQVLCNLINNAIKYTPAKGKIEVRGNTADGYITVEVEDNGYGISEEHAEFVFERMYQCNTELTGEPSSQSGMGIGLFLCQQIIELHGGQLTFQSERGVGSTFSFTLPANPANQAECASSDDPAQ